MFGAVMDTLERLTVERNHVALRVDHDRLSAEASQHGRNQCARQAVAAPVGPDGHPSEGPGRPQFRFAEQHRAQISRTTGFVGDPPVEGLGMPVEVVEVGNVDALLHEEHLGSQGHDLEELIPGQFFPVPDLYRGFHDATRSLHPTMGNPREPPGPRFGGVT